MAELKKLGFLEIINLNKFLIDFLYLAKFLIFLNLAKFLIFLKFNRFFYYSTITTIINYITFIYDQYFS